MERLKSLVALVAGWVFRLDVLLYVLQVWGAVLVYSGIAAFSVPVALIVFGVGLVVAAELWLRGDR